MAELTYFKKFDTKNEYDSYIAGDPVLPNVSIVSGSDVYFTDGDAPEPPHDYSKDYLTFNIISAGTISWKADRYGSGQTIEYKLNDGNWTSITSNTGSSTPTISVNAGDKVEFRGNNAQYGYNVYPNSFSNHFNSTATFEVEGNIMSMMDSTGYATATTLVSAYSFYNLFAGCLGLISAENLVLPATALTDSCYYYLFNSCSGLTAAPKLPATTLANNCYSSMFNGCTSLTTAPELPATTLAYQCYYCMFQGCTSLTTAPELPATTLERNCYSDMFKGCTGLTTVPSILPATTLANGCYRNMFAGCTSLTTAPELPATTLANQCYENMFKGCTSLTTAPELLAETSSYGYSGMFSGCTNLNYIKCLATDIPGSSIPYNWVSGVASSGTFVKNSNNTSWQIGNNGIPEGWAIEDA